MRLSIYTAVDLGECSSVEDNDMPEYYQYNSVTCRASVTQEGCLSSDQCVPSIPAAFEDRLCVYQSGDHSCDGLGDFTVKFIRHESTNDTRDCTTCACETDTNAGRCGGDLVFYTNTSCTGATTTVDAMGECTEGVGGTYKSVNIADWAPICNQSGGVKTGEATFENPVTFCCTQ